MVKPANLIFGVEDEPSNGVNFLLGFQHVTLITMSFVFPVLIVRSMGGSASQATFMVSMSMIAAGLGTFLQSLRRGPIGSGYLCPSLCGPSFLSASILAAKAGGLPLIFGMTIFAGLVEIVLARALKHLRVLFPTEVTGVVVAMVGITVVKLAGTNFLSLDQNDTGIASAGVITAVFTLGAMIGLNVWSSGKLRLNCILLGMALGYAMAAVTGLITARDLAEITNSAWFWFPLAMHPGWAFDWTLALPFGIAMLSSCVKSIGDLTTCQQINDTRWTRPDMDNVSRGIVADALSTVSAGALGGLGQSTSSSNVGLSIATGATSRTIAGSIGLILCCVAFCPKLAAVFAIMPDPVIGATLLFSVSFMVVAGFKIMMSRMIDARKTFVIGLPLILGLMVDILPGAFDALPNWLSPVFASSLSTATIAAVVLNLVFRIGTRLDADINVADAATATEEIFAFFEREGGAWGARAEIVERARNATIEVVGTVLGRAEGPVDVRASFDEYNLAVRLEWAGRPMEFPGEWSDAQDPSGDDGSALLAGFLAGRYVDEVRSQRSEDNNLVVLHLAH